MKRESIAEKWEKEIPGFTGDMIASAKKNPDSAVLKYVLDFLSWQPNEHERKAIAAMGRKRRGEPLTDEDRKYLFTPSSEWGD